MGKSWLTQRLALGAFAAAAATLMGASTQAQDYPARPIQVIVPFAGGSASDVVTRILLDRMAKALGQPFIVDNRPGAGGNTGTLGAVRTAPDGYTLVMSTVGPLAANRTLFKSLGYDPEKDFAPISLFAILPNVVVINSRLPPKTLDRARRLRQATSQGAQLRHRRRRQLATPCGRLFRTGRRRATGHVPYRNIAQYTPDFIAGQVPLGFQFLPNVVGMLSSGDARALAVTSPNA
jgi:tripartite-type tricarboxylate transporter receptor subunit TctC